MRPFNKILFLITIIISFIISGCYTVLWTPEEELPNENTYQQDSGNTYYNDDYYYYYDYPWWLTVSYPVTNINDNNTSERSKDINTLRNTGDGRGTEDTRRDILTPPSPTIDNNSNNNSSGNQNTEVRKATSSGSTSTNTSNTSGRQSSGNNSSVRNSNGSRNNGGGRK